VVIEVHENGEKEEPKEKKRCGRSKPLLRERYMETVEISFENRNRACVHGCKKNSHENTQCLSGYKVHLEVSDRGFPLSALVSGADVHDSQFAIPKEKITEGNVAFCYGLMDTAYDCGGIERFIRNPECIYIRTTGGGKRGHQLSLRRKNGLRCGGK
jgi:hypothetical protein